MYSIASSTKKLKRKSTDGRIFVVRQWLCPDVYGKKGTKTDKNPHGIWPSITQAHLQQVYDRGGYVTRLPNYMLSEHFEGNETLYYYSDSDLAELLLMVDVDVLKSLGKGTQAGALAYINHVNDVLFKGTMFFQSSTNGNGQHGYVRLKNTGDIRAAIRHLETRLRAEAKDFDIELVEVKGTPVRIDRIKGKRVVMGYGTLAKIPRLKTNEEAEKLAATTLLTVDEVLAWDVPTATTSTSGKGSADWWTEDDDTKLNNLTTWAESQGLDEMRTTGRHMVTAQDFACFLVVLTKLASVMKAEDPMRSRRIGGLWSKLYANGHLNRGYDPKRVAVMRNCLSERGLLDWQDHRYYVPLDKDGKAMVWRLGSELQDVIQSAVNKAAPDKEIGAKSLYNTHTSSVGTLTLLFGTGRTLYPERLLRMPKVQPVTWEPSVPDDQWDNLIAA